MEFESGPDRNERPFLPEKVKMEHGTRADGAGGTALSRPEAEPDERLAGRSGSGKGSAGREAARRVWAENEEMLPQRFARTREWNYLLPHTAAASRATVLSSNRGWGVAREERADPPTRPGAEGESRALLYREPDTRAKAAAVDRFAALSHLRPPAEAEENAAPAAEEADRASFPLPAPVPAWLNGAVQSGDDEGFGADIWVGPARTESLQDSRERMATQRFSARPLVMSEAGEAPAAPVETHENARVPLLAVFSLVGGVGKTSLIAALGRTLAALGERVLLADTTPQGLLPFYFGAGDLRPSVLRTVRLPAEASSAAIDLVSLDMLGQGPQVAEEWLTAELSRDSEAASRILLDTSMVWPWMIRVLARMGARLLVPVFPDMNSVLTLNAVEEFCRELQDELGHAVQPVYLLNGFDASHSLHLDVRELLRQQLGDRLLPFVIRRSAAIPEALAESMTVVDYAVGTPVLSDFVCVAEWLKRQPGGLRRFTPGTRWSEA